MQDRILTIRKAVRLSQDRFATVMGISRATMSMIETGKRSPSADMLAKIAKYFTVSAYWLLTGRQEPMIEAGGYKAFRGIMEVAYPAQEPFTLLGDWIYDPKNGCWHSSSGVSFPESICRRMEDKKWSM